MKQGGGRFDWVLGVGHEPVIVEKTGASCWDRLVSLVVHHDPDRDLEVYHEMVNAAEREGFPPSPGDTRAASMASFLVT